MPYIAEVAGRRVFHVGHLDTPLTERGSSRDAFTIPVSSDPEYWRGLHGSNAPQHELFNPAAIWVDAGAFGPVDIAELKQWMITMRFGKMTQAYLATAWNVETGDFDEKFCETEIAAKDAFPVNHVGIAECEAFRLTKIGVNRLGGVNVWKDPFDWFTAAVLLYVRYVVLPKRPMVVGVLWRDAKSPTDKSGEYASLFPERAKFFSVIDEDGEEVGFEERFPNIDTRFTIQEAPEYKAIERRAKMLAEAAANV